MGNDTWRGTAITYKGNVWTTATSTTTIAFDPSFYPLPYVPSARKEGPLEWLDRRIDEMRVKL